METMVTESVIVAFLMILCIPAWSFVIKARKRCEASPFVGTDSSRNAPFRLFAESPPATSNSKDGKRIYSLPQLYDLAFGYRDYEKEVEFLLGMHEKYSKTPSPNKSKLRVLEIAAGPARHSIAALQTAQVEFATAIDNEPEMKKYSQELALVQLGPNHKLEYIVGDMRSFELERNDYDSAWILLGSLQHMTSNEDVIACFQSIHNSMAPGGTVVVELPHPKETFSMVECTRNGWEVPLEDENNDSFGKVMIVWGDDDDEFDPITQVRQFSISMELTGLEDKRADLQSVRQVVPLRLFTAQEIDCLGRCSGFHVAEMYGALDDEVRVDDEDEAFRLVVVLCKV